MKKASASIIPLASDSNLGARQGFYTVCWIQEEIPSIRIGEFVEREVSNALFFI